MYTSPCNAPVLIGLAKDSLIEAVKVGNGAIKEEVRTPFFNLVGEHVDEIILQRTMSVLLM